MKKAILLLLFLALIQAPIFADTTERVNIYYSNGVTYFKDKKFTSAILEFKKVLRIRPYDVTVQNALAMAYLARAQYYTDTEKNFKKAINDYRSALLYLNHWNEEPEASKKVIAQNAKERLIALEKTYAPLNSADLILAEAKNLRFNGELAASIYEYIQLFNNQKYQKNAYQTASDIYKSLNNEKMAIECIRNAINVDKKDGMLRFKYALILEEIGNEDAAMDEYKYALEFSNNNQELLNALQNLWMARSIQNPKDSQALINLGAILQKQNKFELAKAQYIKARQINPNDPVILINLASVLTALGDYDNAILIYDEMLSKNHGDLSARFYKGKLFEKKGDTTSAIKQYREILSLKKDDYNAQNALNNLLSNLNSEQLSGYLKSEADLNPTNYDAQFKYAFEAHKNKMYLPAIEYYKKAIAINQNKPEPFINLAQIFILQKDFTKANNVIAHGLSILPDNKDLISLKENLSKQAANELYAEAGEFYNTGKYREAINLYSKIPYQTPEILTMIANSYYELKENENAINYYNKVLEKDPKNENALFMIANLYMNLQNLDSAREYLNKILAINPNNVDAKNSLKALNEGVEAKLLDSAISSYENKNLNDAILALDKLISINSKNPYAYYYKGMILEEQGKLDSAIAEYKKSTTVDSNFSLGFYMTAVALDNKEQYKEAVVYYDKFVLLKVKDGIEDEYTKYAKERTKELKNYLSQN